MRNRYKRLKYNLKKRQLRNEADIGWGFLFAITAFTFWLIITVIKL